MIARVFPRIVSSHTPRDEYAFVGDPPLEEFLPDGIDLVQVSVTFTWDLPEAQRLARAWERIARVEIGGPALGTPAGDFTPGQFLAPGHVITSRGCPNKCWFCAVPKREGGIRPLPITSGWNILDSNLLACDEGHIRGVFDMLSFQERRPEFTGGIEAKRLEKWHALAMREVSTKQVFFAYDTPDDLGPLRDAARIMLEAGFTRASHALRCYVLCGYPGDTFAKAEKRILETIEAGFTPMAMLFRDYHGSIQSRDWQRFQRKWARPSIIHAQEGAQPMLWEGEGL